MVMGDDPFAGPMHVKKRGEYTDLGEEVEGQAFDQIFAWDDALPDNRLGLAQWLFDEKNPLTSRVHANRLWQSIFGRGLVETSEDFGTQGAIPSHPELLDWLAAELMDNGWDSRHLIKLMVMSETYRQDSSVTEVKKEKETRPITGKRWRLFHRAMDVVGLGLTILWVVVLLAWLLQ